MEAENGVLRVMPGDVIEWEVQITSQSRLRYVWAIFEQETERQDRVRLVLGGDVYSFEKSGEYRVNFANLGYSEEYSDPSEGHARGRDRVGGANHKPVPAALRLGYLRAGD